MPIWNLTQHELTADQVAADGAELDAEDAAAVRAWLSFDSPPTKAEIQDRAALIAQLADQYAREYVPEQRGALVGAATWLLPALCDALRGEGIVPFASFTLRESVEAPQADGSVRKTVVFRHLAWVEVPQTVM